MTRRISFFSLFFMLFLVGKAGFAAYEIAAVVNDRIISSTDLEHRLRLAFLSSGLQDSAEARKNLRGQILSLMIDEALQISTAEKYEVTAKDTEVLQAFDGFENRNTMQPGQLKALLSHNNIPLDVLYQQIRANLSWRTYIYARYHDMVQIGDQEIERFVKQFAVKKDKPQYLVSEIFLSADTDAAWRQAEEKAREFVQELRKGAHFHALAQQFSQSASAAQGGNIGWIVEEDLDTDVGKTLQDLDIGQVSDPIKTENGYYIFLLKDRKAPGESIGKNTLLSFMQVLFPVSQPFSEEKLHPVFEKAKSIAATSKSCGLLKTLARSHTDVQIQEVQKNSVTNMAPQLKELLLGLGLEKASEPILTEMGFMVLMVCAKEDVNPDNPTPDEVREMLLERKLEQLSQREMRDARRDAHIDIRTSGDSS